MHHFEYNKNNIENTIAKAKIYHLSNYFSLTRLCFCPNKCPFKKKQNTSNTTTESTLFTKTINLFTQKD